MQWSEVSEYCFMHARSRYFNLSLSALHAGLTSGIEEPVPMRGANNERRLFSVSDESLHHTPCGDDSFSLLTFLLRTNEYLLQSLKY